MSGGAVGQVALRLDLGVACLVHSCPLEGDVGGGERVVPALVGERERDGPGLRGKVVLGRDDAVTRGLQVDAGLRDVRREWPRAP